MYKDKISEMEEGKDKELMQILADGGKPFMRKCDGYAKKVEEDKEITYKDYNDQELTLKVPAGSYIVTEADSCYPKIVTADDFEKKNKMLEGDKEEVVVVKKSGPSIGLDSIG